MKAVIFTIAIILFTSFAFSQSSSISNISAAQRTDGSMVVDIYYDLSGPEPEYAIAFEVSFDGGTNFSPSDSVSGDAGAGILPGINKHIEWRFGNEYPGQYSDQTKVRLTATVLAWTCGNLFTDNRDNQRYATVQIGTQCWMAENLNIGTMINGSNNQSQQTPEVIEKYCYNNDIAYCDEFGGFYQWNEMMQYVSEPGTQGICPTDWYIPTEEDWKKLEGEVDSHYNYPDPIWDQSGWRGTDVGGNLKETGTSHWNSPNAGATNSSGFTALPSGYRSTGGNFSDLGLRCYTWSSSFNGSNDAWYRKLFYNEAKSGRFISDQSSGYSVRCVRESQTTWSCGEPLEITHTAGDVAPVDKTVSYSTVLTNLSGSDKCWIAQNLGADQQATSASDDTEEAAGWYWQFNKQQGYKHDGTERTPNTPWITSIDENSDWQSDNDPCTILLGTGWRIPTLTEWENADLNGGWENKDDAFNSVLKLHASGYINLVDILEYRGVFGRYWSGTQEYEEDAWNLWLSGGNCNVSDTKKAYGSNVRCLMDTQTNWSCGNPLQVTHTAGDVAPVNKTVNYGTVETDLSGSNKCWITQNLGADQQATSATDDSEASAGWYWQFNRKQGFKHDEVERTPNTPWVSSINENSDWQSDNDPCTILLGTGWRVPTFTEWYNAYENGGWNNYNDTYNSVLKIHAAGWLYETDGVLESRGFAGDYWSCEEYDAIDGFDIYFDNTNFYPGIYSKANGNSIRCL